jgi:hypothetical protein
MVPAGDFNAARKPHSDKTGQKRAILKFALPMGNLQRGYPVDTGSAALALMRTV